MPHFPTYHGTLPIYFNWWNLRHYLLLAYWVFFRPTALKCYLYQAAPEVYRESRPGFKNLRTIFGVPAYRKILLSTILATLWISIIIVVLIGIPTALLVSWIIGLSVNILAWMLIVVFSILFVVFGMFVGVIGGMMSGSVDISVAAGVAGGVAGGVIGGMSVGVIVVSLVLGMVGVGVEDILFGVAFGVAWGVAGGVAGGLTGDIGFGVSVGVAGGVFGGVFGGLTGDIGFGVSMCMACSLLGGLRLVFWPFQLVPALLIRRGGRHPIEWDELLVVPLPNTRHILAQRLQQDETAGLRLSVEVARNPFQRRAVQAALQQYSANHQQPLHFYYQLLDNPDLDVYLFAPLKKGEWSHNISVRIAFIGELGNRIVESAGNNPIEPPIYKSAGNNPIEPPVHRITRIRRNCPVTPLTHFAGLLYDLLIQQEQIEDDEKAFNLAQYREIYEGVQEYPGGAEIARTFAWMADFLSYRTLRDLVTAVDVSLGSARSWATSETTIIRPAVWTVLGRLGSVSHEISVYLTATSRANRQAALLRATDSLKELDQEVLASVVAPEQYLLRRIIRQWQAIIIAEGGEVGREALVGPVPNPYILNNPAEGESFVGRDDIMRRLEELWSQVSQAPSVVIYGHRRMGKTSILHNLGHRFGTQTVIVDFNMQRVGWVSSNADLLYQLAVYIYDECVVCGITELTEPTEQDFSEQPYMNFNRFLSRLDRVRDGRRFIITVDEFEKIEEQIAAGRLTPDLLEFWRGVYTTNSWFVLAFAGLYSLEERRHDYWSPLFGSVTGILVSFLTPGAARRLITEPSPDFTIDYDEAAIEQIIALTNGQPFLLQLIGHTLVTRFNQQTFEEGRERARCFSVDDVDAVLNAPTFDRDGDAYFRGVWQQAERSAPIGQTAVLRALCQRTATLDATTLGTAHLAHPGMTVDELEAATGLEATHVQAALTTLQRHDVVAAQDGRYRYTVELMRRWAARTQVDTTERG